MTSLQRLDAIVILGGGVFSEKVLTDLSKQRLRAGLLACQKNQVKRVIVTGAEASHASLREKYLLKKPSQSKKPFFQAIIKAIGGQDTIGEAIATKKVAQRLNLKRVLLVTSDKHLPRALWIFKRIYGDGFVIKGKGVACGKLLNEKMEKEMFTVIKGFFEQFPGEIAVPSLTKWYEENKELYENFRKIYQKFYPPEKGQKCQAYLNVAYMNKGVLKPSKKKNNSRQNRLAC